MIESDSALTIGPNVTIHGLTGRIGGTSGTVTNNGIIASDQGSVITVQGATNFSGGTLTGGTWQVSGSSTLRIIGANITTNAANLILDGSGSHLYQDGGTTSALANLAANATAGSLTVQNGFNLQTSGAFTNAGLVKVGNGSTFKTGNPAATIPRLAGPRD